MDNLINSKNSIIGRRKQLEQDLEHVTQEMYKRNKELVDTNRILSLLRTIDSLVLESRDSLKVLCSQIANFTATMTEYPFVAILSRETIDAHRPDLEVYGWAAIGDLHGRPSEAISKIRVNPAQNWLNNTDKTLFLDLKAVPIDKAAEVLGCSVETVKQLSNELPMQGVYIVKLMARQTLVGLMAIGFTGLNAKLTERDEALLDRLGDAVGVAIDNKVLFEENQYVLKQLRITNQKLRELDETKDEFISMASHQLRTPLTSVKGYVSMVLEGDAGKIGEEQKKLLNQAFISSQRMVYLIADLLNVSRLKTGKFIIQMQPTQLADVIEGEISQLAETAKGRKLEMVYNKPKDFPVVNLDETKIRQVIMNFVDNAIYYTPAGGHIDVNLVDKGENIEFTVTDTGIGVPKSEQHQMFTKFYRAANAQKARPDGTGLGLFMAQKVIVAQGGAIIFHSEEGKGSTFGFTFSKSKLAELAKAKPTKPAPEKTSTDPLT